MRFVVPVFARGAADPGACWQCRAQRLAVPESTWTDARRAIVARFGPAGRATNALGSICIIQCSPRTSCRSSSTSRTSQSPRHRELLILGPPGCVALNTSGHSTPAAPGTGITSAELTRIARGPEASGWIRSKRPFFEPRTSCTSIRSSAITWSALSAKYDTRQAMDAVFTVAEFTMIAGAVNSLGVPVDDGHKDRLPSDIPYTVTAARTNERLIGKQARVAALEPTEWSPEVRQWLARYSGGRSVAGIYRMHAQHLAMDQPRTRVSEHIRQQSLSGAIRELLIIRIGVLCRSEYEWAAHAPAGRRLGMTDADIQRIVDGSGAGGDPIETVLLRAVDELHRDSVVSDSTWRELAAVFDSKQLLDILITTGGYRMVSMALNSFGVRRAQGRTLSAALR